MVQFALRGEGNLWALYFSIRRKRMRLLDQTSKRSTRSFKSQVSRSTFWRLLMKSANGLAYKSLEPSDSHTYDSVAGEYYDERLHPTCADFRAAASLYLKKFFETRRPAGRLADVGCGSSLIAEFQTRDLVLIDKSWEMLNRN